MFSENDYINFVVTRRSHRFFLPDMPKREDLALIAETGRYAPSGMNRQQCHFLIVTNQEILEKLSAMVSEKLDGFATRDFRYGTPAMIIVCHRKDCTVALQDASCALENMMLAAHALKLGSRWVNQLWRLSDDPDIRGLLAPYGYAENEFIVASLIVGYPDDSIPLKELPRRGNLIDWIE